MIQVKWDLSHFATHKGDTGLQIWQYVNGGGDGGFSCLTTDYHQHVAKHLGVGAISLALNNQIYQYLRDHNLLPAPLMLKTNNHYHEKTTTRQQNT